MLRFLQDSGGSLIPVDPSTQVMAEVMGAQAAAVRVQFVSGTHAISAALYGCLRPGDELLAVAGRWGRGRGRGRGRVLVGRGCLCSPCERRRPGCTLPPARQAPSLHSTYITFKDLTSTKPDSWDGDEPTDPATPPQPLRQSPLKPSYALLPLKALLLIFCQLAS